MKKNYTNKIIQLISFVLFSTFFTANAQSTFVIVNDTVKGGVAVTNTAVELKTYIRNINSSPVVYSWKMIYDNLSTLTDWKIAGVCDNNNCWSTNLTNERTSLPIAVGDSSYFKLDIDFLANPDNEVGVFRFNVYNGFDDDTITFIVNEQTVGISESAYTDQSVTLYPNPIKNNLHIIGQLEGVNEVALFDLHGKKIADLYNHTESFNQQHIIADIPSSIQTGIYSVMISGNKGKYTKLVSIVK